MPNKNEPESQFDSDDIITNVGLSFHQSKVKFGFPVIGIGASAGGLESLEQLFTEIPYDSNAAYVIVQHLSPDFKSMMDEILSRRTKMRVRRIEDGMSIEPSTIYLIPPKADLELDQEKLYLRERIVRQGLNQPIDRFFRRWRKVEVRLVRPWFVVAAEVTGRGESAKFARLAEWCWSKTLSRHTSMACHAPRWKRVSQTLPAAFRRLPLG